MKKIVGLWLHHSKSEAETLSFQISHWFQAKGWEVLTEWKAIMENKPQFLISLGGDGTLLQAAREGAAFGIPVMGVNLGRLGFLCEIEKNEVYEALGKLVRREFIIEERMMLNAIVNRLDGEDYSQIALNDVVFTRDSMDGIVSLQANISGEPSVSYTADGLIVSTPTGSTAYSLAAGGPIISPNVRSILITPLAAHTLSARPMVVSDTEEIEILLTSGKQCLVTFDGRNCIRIRSGETVTITMAAIKAQLIRLGNRSFPKVVRQKLRDR